MAAGNDSTGGGPQTPSADHQQVLAERLAAAVARHLDWRLPGDPSIAKLARLTAGAANETWSFDVQGGADALGCILRRSPAVVVPASDDTAAGTNLGKAGEAVVQQAARAAGVAAPEVLFILDADDGLGDGYVMARLEGETLPRRILRDEMYADLRERLAELCGETLAGIHGVDPAALPPLALMTAREQIERYGEIYRGFGQPVAVFELTLRWLTDHLRSPERLSLVHGDFRNGNLMVGPEGIRAVLDWELAHLGDPMEDLGWLCVNSWRFGEVDHPVGGFGRREALFAGYEAAGGGRVDPEAVRYWEVFGTLKWGIMCMIMTHGHLAGVTRSVEKAAIGRRVSETELDLLNLLR